MQKAHYAVYVSNPRGWERDCPDSEGVFFSLDGVPYVRWAHLLADDTDAVRDLGVCGFVVVQGHAAAVEIINGLRKGGDWSVGDNGEVERPEYGCCRLSGDGSLA